MTPPVPWYVANLAASERIVLDHLRLTPLQVVLQTTSEWKGPAIKAMLLRSGLGYHLRAQECLTGAAACEGCLRTSQCWYATAFDSAGNVASRSDALLHHGDARVSHPYYLATAPLFERELAAGSFLPCLLTVFGQPDPLLSKILSALKSAGRSARWGGGFRICRYASALTPDSSTTIQRQPQIGLVGAMPRWKPNPTASLNAVRLRFLSPLRLRIAGTVEREPAFPEIVRALLRRIHILAGLYSRVKLEQGWAQSLVDLARTAQVVHSQWTFVGETRRSGRQHRSIPIDGVLGELTVAGDLSRLWPFLDAGQWTGVGASTSHGLGCFILELP